MKKRREMRDQAKDKWTQAYGGDFLEQSRTKEDDLQDDDEYPHWFDLGKKLGADGQV